MTRDMFMYIILAFVGILICICFSFVIMYYITYYYQSRVIREIDRSRIHESITGSMNGLHNHSNHELMYTEDNQRHSMTSSNRELLSCDIKEYVFNSIEPYVSIAIAKDNNVNDYKVVIQPSFTL